MQNLFIPDPVHRAMIDHCIEEMPNEACGFLGGAGSVVQKLYPLTNAAASPVYYRPDGPQMLRAMDDLEDRGLELLAIFHSHVASPPVPSATDVREAHHPDCAYVIVSLMWHPPLTRCYMIRKQDWRDEEGEIVEIPLVISS